MSVIYIFESLHKLIKADKLLSQQGVEVRVIPVPTSYHSVCGMCLEAQNENNSNSETAITTLLAESEIAFTKHIILS